jgi:hypothetical protein
MHFETAFDLVEVGYKSWWFPAFGLIFIPIGIAFLFVPGLSRFISWRLLPNRWRRVSDWLSLGFALIWTFGTFILTFTEYIAARDALTSGRYSVAEGQVVGFKPMPYEGHGRESFTVAGKRFSYSDFEVMPGFNNTHSHGGPIDNGVYVRVTYSGNTILRLEIAR